MAGRVCAVVAALTVCITWASSTTSPTNESAWTELREVVTEAHSVLREQTRLLHRLLNSTLACHGSNIHGWWCPLPYKQVLAECFYLSPHLLPWQQARGHCLALSGDLATPAAIVRLFSFVLDDGATDTDRVWVGGTDRNTGSWRWLNGRSIPRADWEKQQPNNWGGNQHCLNLRLDRPALNDADCDLEYRFVCQYIRPE